MSCTAIFKSLSAAPKNMGPVISYTTVFFGTFIMVPSGSSSGSTYFQPETSVTSLMRFMNRIQVKIRPTSMATTRSNNTVNTKVKTSTKISLLGAVLQRFTNSLQPHIL